MCQFETPLFIIYSYLAVIVIALITSLSIILKNPQKSLNRNAFYFIAIIGLWTAIDLGRWTAHDADESYLFLRLSYIIVMFFPFFLFFSYALIGRELSYAKKALFVLPSMAIILAMVGDYGIGSVNDLTCSYRLGWLIFPSILLALAYTIWSSAVLVNKYRHPEVHYKKKLQIGVMLFTIVFSVSWGIAYEIVDIFNGLNFWHIEISPYSILGNLFFMAAIAFNIVEYDLFEFNFFPRKWFAFAVLSVVFLGMSMLALTPIFHCTLWIFYSMAIWMFWGK